MYLDGNIKWFRGDLKERTHKYGFFVSLSLWEDQHMLQIDEVVSVFKTETVESKLHEIFPN